MHRERERERVRTDAKRDSLKQVWASMSEVTDSREPEHRSIAGFSLLEAVAALAIVGMALVVAAHALSAYAATIRRAEVHQRLLWAAENAIESVRGGQIPLTTGRVELERDLRPTEGADVFLFVDVRPRDLPGLYDVEVRAWSQLPARREVVELSTMVWRP
jgi:type II secretory pathway pseudopilin PulG